MIAQDMARALDVFDMAEGLSAQPVPEAALAKLEFVIQKDNMPPTRCLALHWNAGLSAADRDSVLGLVRATRKDRHATADAPEAVKDDVLQPLPRRQDLDPAKVALGRRLFHDTRLSGDGTVSCASCHDLAKGGTDRAPVSTGIRSQKGPINAPTVYNAGFQVRQFWDGRAADLKEQAAGPVANPAEMGAKWDDLVATLDTDEQLVKAMRAAYPEGVRLAKADCGDSRPARWLELSTLCLVSGWKTRPFDSATTCRHPSRRRARRSFGCRRQGSAAPTSS